jgi:hypothetical protein
MSRKQKLGPVPIRRVQQYTRSNGDVCIYDCILSSTTQPAVTNAIEKMETWYLNGVVHRDGGPAVTNNNGQFWFQNGQFHREDGKEEWYKNGVQFDP